MKHLYPQLSAWIRPSAGKLTDLHVGTEMDLGMSDMGKGRELILSVWHAGLPGVCAPVSALLWLTGLLLCEGATLPGAATVLKLLESQWTARESQTAGNNKNKGTGGIRHWKASACWPYQTFSWDFARKETQVEFCQAEASQMKMHGTWYWLGAAQYTVEETCSLTTWSVDGPGREIKTSISGQWKAAMEQKWDDYFIKGIVIGQVWVFLVCVCSWQLILIFKSPLSLHRTFIHWGMMIILNRNHLCLEEEDHCSSHFCFPFFL